MPDADAVSTDWSATRNFTDGTWRSHALQPSLFGLVSPEALGDDPTAIKQLDTRNWIGTQRKLVRLGTIQEKVTPITDCVLVFKETALTPGPADAIVMTILHGLTPTNFGAVRWSVGAVMLAGQYAGDVWQDPAVITLELRIGQLVADGLAFLATNFGQNISQEFTDRPRRQPLEWCLAQESRLPCQHISSGSRFRRYGDGCRTAGSAASARGYIAIPSRKLFTGSRARDVNGRREQAGAYRSNRLGIRARW